MEDLTPLLGLGGLGAAVTVVIILIRTGILKISLGKNGSEEEDPRVENELLDRMTKLELHFNEETTYGLKRIEEAITKGFDKTDEKLEKLNEGIVFIKARLNGHGRN